MKVIDSIFDKGIEANSRGKGLENNPYNPKKELQKFESWRKGWRYAEKLREELR